MRVTIRTQANPRERFVADLPLDVDPFESVVSLLRRWGLTSYGYDAPADDLTGQFVLDDEGFRFVVQVEDED